jgi:hypothetical protein
MFPSLLLAAFPNIISKSAYDLPLDETSVHYWFIASRKYETSV